MDSVKAPALRSEQLDPSYFAEQVNAYIAAGVPRMYGMGIRVLELDARRVVGTVPLEGNGNHLGSMYAGTLFGLAEMLGGAIARPTFDFAEYYPTVKQVTLDFRRPARSDVRGVASLAEDTIDRIRAEAGEVGKAEFTVDAELIDTDGVVVATSRGIYQVRAVAAG